MLCCLLPVLHYAARCYLTPGVSSFITLPEASQRSSLETKFNNDAREQRGVWVSQAADPEVAPLNSLHRHRQINHDFDERVCCVLFSLGPFGSSPSSFWMFSSVLQ